MKICFFANGRIPVKFYGGIERVVWWLGKELSSMGHSITLIAAEGSDWPFGKCIVLDNSRSLDEQIPDDIDLVHFHFVVREKILKKPYLITCHGNFSEQETLDINTLFVSENHANRLNSDAYVYNGIDTNEYGVPALDNRRSHLLFLGNAAWRIKNVKESIRLATDSNNKLEIIGGRRINFKMGFRLTTNLNVRFNGMVGGTKKNRIIQNSKGLIFPVLWHEPYGLALIESMYFGSPVIATPYGSIPELVTPETGFYSKSRTELLQAIQKIDDFDRKKIHEYVMENFTSKQMASNYIKYYEKVLNGKTVNKTNPVLKTLKPRDWFDIID